jgi:hypothetical protein
LQSGISRELAAFGNQKTEVKGRRLKAGAVSKKSVHEVSLPYGRRVARTGLNLSRKWLRAEGWV